MKHASLAAALVVFLVATVAWVASEATAGQLAGRASVIDGDTLDIHGQRIRLHGIDAPESGQTCKAGGSIWRCGQQAARALDDMLAGRPVECAERDVDRYGRIVAVCELAGQDINGWMVDQGWALAYRDYSTDYIGEEGAARSAGRGVWRGDFVAPWDWRRGDRLEVSATNSNRDGNCTIKGNVNSSGERIYHVPNGQHYSRTKIDQDKGERWFCSEAEAEAAGWRPSQR